MELIGLGNLLTKLEQLKRKFHVGQPPEVVIGYTQRYAVYVHEVPARHTVGNWKYLTNPARRLVNDGTIKNLIVEALQTGAKLGPAMIRAGQRIQRESQNEVPVDTSALKASAFTAYSHEVEGKARAAFDLSEAIRISTLESRKKSKK